MYQHFSMVRVLVCVLIFLSPIAMGDVKNSIEPDQAGLAKPMQQKLPDAQKEIPRGQLLYENHCGGCHESSVHGRDPRKASTINEIKQWVTRWQKDLKLNWPVTDIDEVTRYLNSRYYQYSE